MLEKGDHIIVRDSGLLDVYCATVEQPQANEQRYNPLVRVRYLLAYPIQHAILWPDVPNENPPLQAGALARLTFVRRCTPGEEAHYTYDEAFRLALDAAMHSVASEAERGILARHREGRYGKKRLECRH